jgi:hypothetical protein
MAGPDDRRRLPLDEHPEHLAVACQDGVDEGAVIERRGVRFVDREVDSQRSPACQSDPYPGPCEPKRPELESSS